MEDNAISPHKDPTEKKSVRHDTIEKFVFDDEVHFTTILNPALQTHIRDATSLGIYCYLMSLPKDWKVIPAQIASHFSLNVETVRKKLKILIEAKYMLFGRSKIKGQFKAGVYLIFRTPWTLERKEEIQKKFPHTVFPCAAKPDAVETHNTNKREIQRKEETTTVAPQSTAPPSDSSLFSLFDKRRKYFKDCSDEEIGKVKSLYEEANLKKEISNPEGWITACVKEKWWLKSIPKEDKVLRHQRLAKWIVGNYPDKNRVIEGYNYLEFTNGQAYDHLKFGQVDFEEKCQRYLENANLKMPTLK